MHRHCSRCRQFGPQHSALLLNTSCLTSLKVGILSVLLYACIAPQAHLSLVAAAHCNVQLDVVWDSQTLQSGNLKLEALSGGFGVGAVGVWAAVKVSSA
jgi:hypothetical protein